MVLGLMCIDRGLRDYNRSSDCCPQKWGDSSKYVPLDEFWELIWQCVKTFSFSLPPRIRALVRQSSTAARGSGSPWSKRFILHQCSMHFLHCPRASQQKEGVHPVHCIGRSFYQQTSLPALEDWPPRQTRLYVAREFHRFRKTLQHRVKPSSCTNEVVFLRSTK